MIDKLITLIEKLIILQERKLKIMNKSREAMLTSLKNLYSSDIAKRHQDSKAS